MKYLYFINGVNISFWPTSCPDCGWKGKSKPKTKRKQDTIIFRCPKCGRELGVSESLD